jgi:hypothetical protein
MRFIKQKVKLLLGKPARNIYKSFHPECNNKKNLIININLITCANSSPELENQPESFDYKYGKGMDSRTGIACLS